MASKAHCYAVEVMSNNEIYPLNEDSLDETAISVRKEDVSAFI